MPHLQCFNLIDCCFIARPQLMHLLLGFFLFVSYINNLWILIVRYPLTPYQPWIQALLKRRHQFLRQCASCEALRVARSFTSKEPKPTICILPPCCSVSVITSIKAPANIPTSFFENSVFFACYGAWCFERCYQHMLHIASFRSANRLFRHARKWEQKAGF